jgi:hypothetical protein
LSEFLQNLCKRTQQGPPFTGSTPPPAPAPTTTTPTPGPAPGTTTSGGTSATAAAAKPPPIPITGDEIYCTTVQHFSADLHTPPLLQLLTTKLRSKTRAGVRFTPAKAGSYSVTLRATDLAGNSASTTGFVTLASAPKAHKTVAGANSGD